MKAILKNTSKILRFIADFIDRTECEEEIIDICATQQVHPLDLYSKEQAASYLNVSTRQFARLVALGEIPKGKRLVGFKQVFWTLADLSALKKHK